MNRKHPGTRPYGLLDTVRGLCLISMVLYHGMYDLVNVKGYSVPWYNAPPGYWWQQSICWTFILLSGLCWQLSRRPLKRGLILAGCGAAITLTTWFIMPSELIQYGVLTLLGLSALLLIPLHGLLKKAPPLAGLFCSFGLFLLLRNVPNGSLGFEGLRLCTLPDWFYRSDLFAVLGFPTASFSSSDYFPLIPWFFLFATGYSLWSLLSRWERAKNCLRPGFAPLAFLGRHSLVIYLAHQPVLMALFWLLPSAGTPGVM